MLLASVRVVKLIASFKFTRGCFFTVAVIVKAIRIVTESSVRASFMIRAFFANEDGLNGFNVQLLFGASVLSSYFIVLECDQINEDLWEPISHRYSFY